MITDKKNTNQQCYSTSCFVLLKRLSYFYRTQKYTCYVQSFYWLPIHPVSKVFITYSGMLTIAYNYVNVSKLRNEHVALVYFINFLHYPMSKIYEI
jgi:hypothetical protein